MKHLAWVLAVVVIVTCLSSEGLWSQGGKQAIKRGASKKGARDLVKAADNDANDVEETLLKLEVDEVKQVENDLDKERKALEKSLKKRKEFSAFRKQFDDLGKSDQGAKQVAALKQLFQKNSQMVQSAYTEASVDKSRVASTLASRLRLPVALAAGSSGDQFLIGPSPTAESPVSGTALILRAPFDEPGSSKKSQLIVRNKVSVSENGATNHDGISLILGRGTSRAVAGSFVTVSPGFTRLKVTAKVDTDHFLISGAIAGVSSSRLDVLIELMGAKARTQSSRKRVAKTLAPLIGFTTVEGQDLHIVTKTFRIPKTGGEFLVRAGTQVVFASLANGNGGPLVSGQVREIAVEPLP